MSARPPVSLRSVVDLLCELPHDAEVLLDEATGEVIFYWVDGDPPEETKQPEFEERWEEYRRTGAGFFFIRTEGDDAFDDREWIPSFCRDVPNAAPLAESFRGKGGFRRFREGLQRRGLQDAWEEYRRERIVAEARELLEAQGIPFTDDLPAGGASKPPRRGSR